MTQTPQTRLSLAGFSPKKARLIRKMEDHGWTGRISSNGHAIMRAPAPSDLTCSVSPKMGSGRGLMNDEQAFKRWMREHGARSAAEADRIRAENDRQTAIREIFGEEATPAPVDTAPFPIQEHLEHLHPEPEISTAPAEVVKTRVACTEPDCTRDFATLQAMSVHRVRVHAEKACQFCGRTMSPSGIPRHERTHAEELADPFTLLREVYRLREELTEARADAAAWERMADEAEDRYAGIQSRARTALEALSADD